MYIAYAVRGFVFILPRPPPFTSLRLHLNVNRGEVVASPHLGAGMVNGQPARPAIVFLPVRFRPLPPTKDLRFRALDALTVWRGVFQYLLLQFGPGHRLGGALSAGSRGSHS